MRFLLVLSLVVPNVAMPLTPPMGGGVTSGERTEETKPRFLPKESPVGKDANSEVFSEVLNNFRPESELDGIPSMLTFKGNSAETNPIETKEDTRTATDQAMLSESETLRFVSGTQSMLAVAQMALGFMGPATAMAVNNAFFHSQNEQNNYQTSNAKYETELSPEWLAIIKCSDEALKKAREEKKPKTPFETISECRKKLSGEPTQSGTPTTPANTMSALPAHSKYIKEKAPTLNAPELILNEPNQISLSALLLNRKIAQLSALSSMAGATGGPYGIGAGLGAVGAQAKKSLEEFRNEIKPWMDRFLGDYVFEYDKQVTKVIKKSPQISSRQNYKNRFKEAFRDIGFIVSRICTYENNLSGATGADYTPFRTNPVPIPILGGAITVPGINQAAQNDFWSRIEEGDRKLIQTRIRNLRAGVGYQPDLSTFVSLNDLFIKIENPQEVGAAPSGGTTVKIKCDLLEDESHEKIENILASLERGVPLSNASKRLQHQLKLAHFIAEGQMAWEAVRMFQILEEMHGQPPEDRNLFGKDWAIYDYLRTLVVQAGRVDGKFPQGMQIEVLYTSAREAILAQEQALRAEAAQLSGQSRLAGFVSEGTGSPFGGR